MSLRLARVVTRARTSSYPRPLARRLYSVSSELWSAVSKDHVDHGPVVVPTGKVKGRLRLSDTQASRVNPVETEELGLSLPTLDDLGLLPGDDVVVAMSGGVDSSLTLQLLSNLPLNLSVIFMRNWDALLSESPSSSPSSPSSSKFSYAYSTGSSLSSPSSSSYPSSPSISAAAPTPCQWERDFADVRRVCTHVGIPASQVRLVDLSREYWGRVFEPAVGVWEKGGTPNPDVACNREIKFGALFEHLTPGHFLATGHYARVRRDRHNGSGVGATLHRARDMNKDQTYYLSQLNNVQLSRSVFPLAGLAKPDVRRLAKYYGLPTASREESMGVCFIGERGNFGDFISQYTSPASGYLVSPSGERLAPHKGQWHYTVGQRARIPGMDGRWFVARKNVGAIGPAEGAREGEDILVVPGSDHPALACLSVESTSFHWIAGHPPPSIFTAPTSSALSSSFRALVQVRHRMPPVPATVHVSSDLASERSRRVRVEFDESITGVAMGQIVAIWTLDNPGEERREEGEEGRGGRCLGSGTIDESRCVEEPWRVKE